jgi:hypothetical protein
MVVDDVAVAAVACIQQVLFDKVYDAFYRLTDPQSQIRMYVFDVIRSTMPKLELDQVSSHGLLS